MKSNFPTNKKQEKDAFSNAPQKPYKREIALDCSSFRRIQSRAISLHSYYLTSLVNLSFYSFLPQSFLHFSDPDCSFLHTLSELPMFYRNHFSVWGLFFGGSFLIIGGSIFIFSYLLFVAYKNSYYRLSSFALLFSRFCFRMIYDLYSFFQRR